jgi:hypothetical protein
MVERVVGSNNLNTPRAIKSSFLPRELNTVDFFFLLTSKKQNFELIFTHQWRKIFDRIGLLLVALYNKLANVSKHNQLYVLSIGLVN